MLWLGVTPRLSSTVARLHLKKLRLPGSGYVDTAVRLGERLIQRDLQESSATAIGQLALIESYQRRFHAGAPPPPFRSTGFSVFSQHEEDGLLLYLFALLGTENRVAVELCAGDGIECNSANLLIHHRWTGVLCDGNEDNVRRGRAYYSRGRTTRYWPPSIVQAWITRETVNEVVAKAGCSGAIDLLSLDIDGMDYWVWEALDIIEPRVVVLEFNHLWGPDEAVSVPYAADFKATFTRQGSDYAGASLAAFVSLGKRKGYKLVGTNAFATNAFFVRQDLEHPWLPEIPTNACFDHPRARFGMQSRLPLVRDREWVQV